jgi:hypothetical protein
VVGDARQFGIAQRRLPAIAARGSWRPAINANRCAIRQSLRGSDEQETTPTANVEDALMPTPGDGAQQLVPDTELPAQTIVEHTDRHDQEVQTERQAEPPQWNPEEMGLAESEQDPRADQATPASANSPITIAGESIP